MKTRAYDSLAERFEDLNDDCGYEEWTRYLLSGLERFGASGDGLELGCGSGAFCRALTRAGYRMDGADVSAQMLTKAEYLAREEGLSVRFFLADAAKLTVPKKYGFILSPNDCFNYIAPARLASAFRGVFSALNKGGLFWFDISSAYKLREKVANNIFADDRDDVTYLSFNTLKEDRVEMDVTLFQRRADGAFDRFDERHTQYIHEEADVRAALERAGFSVLAAEGHLGGEKEGSDRLNFICQK